MVQLAFKWLASCSLQLICLFQGYAHAYAGTPPLITPSTHHHPFHVSVVEINHNATNKSLEISCKIFTDDFEKVLTQNYKTKVDLINPPVKKAMDSLVKDYIFSHLSVKADGKPGTFSYVGFEHQEEAVYGYVEIDNISSVKNVDIVDKLMYDLFSDQVNIVHVIVGGNRKSTKLDYPQTAASVSF